MKSSTVPDIANSHCRTGVNRWSAELVSLCAPIPDLHHFPMFSTGAPNRVYLLSVGITPPALSFIKSLFRNLRELLVGIFSRAGANRTRSGRKIGCSSEPIDKLGSTGAIAFHQKLEKQEYLDMPAEMDQNTVAVGDEGRTHQVNEEPKGRYEREFTAAKSIIERLLGEGKLKPHQTTGLTEFMALLNAGEQPADKSIREFLQEFRSGTTQRAAAGGSPEKGWVN